MRLLNKYRLYIALAVCAAIVMAITLIATALSDRGVEAVDAQAAEQVTEPLETMERLAEAQPMIAVETSMPIETEAPETDSLPIIAPNEDDVEMLAKLIWGEARGVSTIDQKAAVVWCVLNRVDARCFPNTIAEVVTQKYQFSGWNESFPATLEHRDIAADVLVRWYQEKAGVEDVGRVLPKEYTFFVGDGVRNYFSAEWRSTDYYDWSLPSPYGK